MKTKIVTDDGDAVPAATLLALAILRDRVAVMVAGALRSAGRLR